MIVYWCKARIYMIVVGIEKMEVACDESNHIMVLVEDLCKIYTSRPSLDSGWHSLLLWLLNIMITWLKVWW